MESKSIERGRCLNLKPYPEYKDSGSPWAAEIPSHWEVRNLRTLIRPLNERNRADLPLLSVTREKGVFVRSLMDADENHNVIPEDLSSYKVARAGNLVINKMKAWQGSMGIAPSDGIVSPAYFVFDFGISNCAFGQALLRSKPYVAHFAQASDGVRVDQWDLSIAGMRQIPALIPPPDEQDTIVRFLDRADHQIRRFVRAKRRLIELLNEQKQAIIGQAVTRGLDPNVRLKPSGIDWLGSVPAHWIVKPAKYFLREVDGRSDFGKEELLSVSHITGVCPRSQKSITMFMAASYVGHKVCLAGDLVINTMWAWIGAMGVAKQTGIVSPSYSVYRPWGNDEFVPGFLDHLVRTKPYISEYICRSTGIRSSRLRLYPEDFLGIPLIQPPEEEQLQIVSAIERETGEIGGAISRANREIDLIREFRTRLIADAVTGKLDVRGVELPEVEEPVELPEEESEVETEEEDAATGLASDADEVPA